MNFNDNFVIGRTSKEGNLQDIRIHVNADGLNRVDIARDPKDLSSRIYVVDRRTLPDGPWRRLLEVESFSDTTPDRLSEVRANIDCEVIPNFWNIDTKKTWGLPEGMESPWFKPLEMVGNELLLSEESIFVSGDAPVNTIKGNIFQNGKYRIEIDRTSLTLTSGDDTLGVLDTNLSSLFWSEGIAGALSFSGGSVYMEPAKPPLFMGTFYLDKEPIQIKDALYQYGDYYLIASHPITDREFTGAFSLVKDPFPERWVERVFCRAYVDLISPAYKPPITEDEPERISIRVEYPETDFTDIKPKIVTPYSNETGVFNSWMIDESPVNSQSKERPWDILLPFRDLQDWGGYPVESLREFYPARDFLNEPHAAYPSDEGYELPNLPEIPEGTIFLRWKDSSFFWIIRNDWIDIFYRDGWVYHENKVSPDSSGIAPVQVKADWNNLKVEWSADTLIVNDQPALTQERLWGEVLGEEGIWGNVTGLSPSQWKPDPDYPIDVEQYHEVLPVWETGKPEGEVVLQDPDYTDSPRTWGRVLYERFGLGLNIHISSSLHITGIDSLLIGEME